VVKYKAMAKERLIPVSNCTIGVKVTQADLEACGEVLPNGQHDNAFRCPRDGRWVDVHEERGKV
jgi:hypothetical protein